MESPLSVTYHQDESRADVRVDPVAGEGFALGVKSPPRAIMCWRDSGGGRSNAHLLDRSHAPRVRNDADACGVAIALAQRFNAGAMPAAAGATRICSPAS
ncbi:hypothetical protein [Burkholderia sp. 567]|uniref:hypothetical protein n=1 Tax=Burkholderia sp. 567 TaxID=3156413 RepID=UPI00339944C8